MSDEQTLKHELQIAINDTGGRGGGGHASTLEPAATRMRAGVRWPQSAATMRGVCLLLSRASNLAFPSSTRTFTASACPALHALHACAHLQLSPTLPVAPSHLHYFTPSTRNVRMEKALVQGYVPHISPELHNTADVGYAITGDPRFKGGGG